MRKVASVLLLALSWNAAHAYENTPRSIPLGKHGALEVQAPATWKESIEPAANGVPASLKLNPKTGARFEVFLTPFIPEEAGGKIVSMDELRKVAREMANSIAFQAVEKPIELKEIRGTTNGYYFSVTDKAPKPTEYKFMSQGVLSVGQLRVMFTILSNDGQQAVVKEALTVVTGAAHR